MRRRVVSVTTIVLVWLMLVQPTSAMASPCWQPPVGGTVAVPFSAPACWYCAGHRGMSTRLLRRRQHVLSPPAPSPTAELSPASCTSWSDMATGGKSPTESWCRLICGAATGWWLDRGSVRRRAECTLVCGLAVSIGIQRPISGARPAAPVSCLSTARATGRRRYRSGVVATWGELGRGRCV